MKRIYESVLIEHFQMNKQMAFVCGPRQVGKTTISQSIREIKKDSVYRNWDIPEDRIKIAASSYLPALEGLTLSPASHPLIIFDEIHKFSDWKNYLKGFYDSYAAQIDILVTGSARLNIYKKSGDSLMGRYLLYRVHPISLAEKSERTTALFQAPHIVTLEDIQRLLHFGGFPEPLHKANERFLNQWRNLRWQQLIYEDIRSLEAIQNLSQLELLATLLQHQSGQLVNYSALATKVKVSLPTIQRWISILEQVYFCFSLRPWSKNITRSLIKEPKIYLWDWSLISTDKGSLHENFVASHLLKAVHFWTDVGLGLFELYFIRTKDQVEVDFLITKNSLPWILVEVKSSSKTSLSKALQHYKDILCCPFAFQLAFDFQGNQKSIDWLSAHVLAGKDAPACILPVGDFLSMLV